MIGALGCGGGFFQSVCEPMQDKRGTTGERHTEVKHRRQEGQTSRGVGRRMPGKACRTMGEVSRAPRSELVAEGHLVCADQDQRMGTERDASLRPGC